MWYQRWLHLRTFCPKRKDKRNPPSCLNSKYKTLFQFELWGYCPCPRYYGQFTSLLSFRLENLRGGKMGSQQFILSVSHSWARADAFPEFHQRYPSEWNQNFERSETTLLVIIIVGSVCLKREKHRRDFTIEMIL